jgi:hypothetical protein
MHAVRARVWAAVAAVAGFSAMPAGAAELGFYVGFLYGDATKDFDREQFSSIAASLYQGLEHISEERTFTTDSDGSSYGFMAGYRLTEHIAFEGGYLTLGKQNYHENSSGFFFPNDDSGPVNETWDLSLTSRTSGFALSALGILPLSYAWEVYARAGVLFGSNTLNVYASNGETTLTLDDTQSSTDWLAGVGISMSLAEVYAIRAEYVRIFDAGAPVFGEADQDVVSIGLTVSF